MGSTNGPCGTSEITKVISLSVLEVVCGDYGDVTEYLVKAAEDDKWRNVHPISEFLT